MDQSKQSPNLWSEHDDKIEYFADTYIRDFAHEFVDEFAATYALQLAEDLGTAMRDDFAFMFSKDYSEHFADETGAHLPEELIHRYLHEYAKYEDQGELMATVKALWMLCRNRGYSEEQAMEAMGIPTDKRIVYEAAMRHAKQAQDEEGSTGDELEALEEFVIDMPEPGPDQIIHYESGEFQLEMPASRDALGADDEQILRRIRDLIGTDGLQPEEALDALEVPDMDRQAYLLLLSMEDGED